MSANTASDFNVAFGHEAGFDIGGKTLNYNATRNTVIGNLAGVDIGDGVGNTCVGSNDCENTEYADFNSFVGINAGSNNNRNNNNNNDNAQRNTGLGSFAGFMNHSGSDNVWVGAFADSGPYNAYSHSDAVNDTLLTKVVELCRKYSNNRCK